MQGDNGDAVRAATADIDANATESKTVMMLQKCCLIVVPDVWSLFQRYNYYISYGIDSSLIAPIWDSWIENILNRVSYTLKV